MIRKLTAIAMAAAMLAGCEEPVFAGRNIIGGYYLAPDGSIAGGEKICLLNSSGRCDIRAPGPVTGLGVDDEYISLKTYRGVDTPDDYYIIVQLFDSMRADGERCLTFEAERLQSHRNKGKRLKCDSVFKKTVIESRDSNCAIRGPFSEAEFGELQRCNCVPVAPGSDEVKCIPGVGDMPD